MKFSQSMFIFGLLEMIKFWASNCPRNQSSEEANFTVNDSATGDIAAEPQIEHNNTSGTEEGFRGQTHPTA